MAFIGVAPTAVSAATPLETLQGRVAKYAPLQGSVRQPCSCRETGMKGWTGILFQQVVASPKRVLVGCLVYTFYADGGHSGSIACYDFVPLAK
jgi:hypothetical protein